MASISLKYKSKQGNLTAPGDVDPGAMIPIATTTVGAGGAASVTFSSIPQGYEHLQVRSIYSVNATDGNVECRVGSGSVDSSGVYASHLLRGNGSTAIAASTINDTYTHYLSTWYTSGSQSSFIVDILDYSNTNKFKTLRSLFGNDSNGAGYTGLASGLWRSTSGLDTVYLYPSSGSFQQYSSFALYGIKRAGA